MATTIPVRCMTNPHYVPGSSCNAQTIAAAGSLDALLRALPDAQRVSVEFCARRLNQAEAATEAQATTAALVLATL
jgi:hypothetical protein